MTNNATQTVENLTREQVVLNLLVPHKNGFTVDLEAGKQRTGFVSSIFHKGQRGVWRVLHKEGDVQPHIQIQVGDQVRRIDDLTYTGFIDSVRALFEAQQAPEPISEADRVAALAALTPVPLQNFMASISQPNEADQTWSFDAETGTGEVNAVTGTVHFLRGELALPFRVELVEYERKGQRRHKLMLSVGEHDAVRVRNVDDAIEAAYAEFDLHRPNQQRHLVVIYDPEGNGVDFFRFHIGTRISNLAKAANGHNVHDVLDKAEFESKAKALDDFYDVFLAKNDECRYTVNAVDVICLKPLVQTFDLVTVLDSGYVDE